MRFRSLSNSQMSLCVSNLPLHTDREDLRSVFTKHGKCRLNWFVRVRQGRIVFCEYEDSNATLSASKALPCLLAKYSDIKVELLPLSHQRRQSRSRSPRSTGSSEATETSFNALAKPTVNSYCCKAEAAPEEQSAIQELREAALIICSISKRNDMGTVPTTDPKKVECLMCSRVVLRRNLRLHNRSKLHKLNAAA